jgi:ribA/ribD-fused uncharacterized protein
MGKGPTIDGVYYEEFGNYYQAPIMIDGIQFNCVEQYYQYTKCQNNTILQKKIMGEMIGKEMWKLGQKCELPKGWDEYKFDVMEKGMCAMIAQNKNLGDVLKKTTGKIIFNEGGIWDEYNEKIITKIRLLC